MRCSVVARISGCGRHPFGLCGRMEATWGQESHTIPIIAWQYVLVWSKYIFSRLMGQRKDMDSIPWAIKGRKGSFSLGNGPNRAAVWV